MPRTKWRTTLVLVGLLVALGPAPQLACGSTGSSRTPSLPPPAADSASIDDPESPLDATAAEPDPTDGADSGMLPASPGSCATDADCRLARVYTCAEILSCTSACEGAGELVALPGSEPDPVRPSCGPQPPCTPACPAPVPVARPPRAACVDGHCTVLQDR
ncbi:MAG: hypothetical protein HY907_15860 [Deltaproteobacteria bacterium]|nr:hypothetical protein [Deltaproteobacteria bacterium]